MNINFYREFERRFRGSTELITSRLRVYEPLLSSLKEHYSDLPALDLGCGRGEWLTVLKEHGFSAIGVDQDQGMLSCGAQDGLNTYLGDALSYLKGQPDNSQVIISAFHLVEHISFEDLYSLVSESHRVLKPGGILLMETPNPENLMVATSYFYLDPTHRRPIPLGLLSFVVEYCGFSQIKVMRLQENNELLNETPLSFRCVLEGASPDYAVVAQKDSGLASLSIMSEEFSKDYGVSLADAVDVYESSALAQNRRLEESIKKLQDELEAIKASWVWRFGACLSALGNLVAGRKQK